MIELGFVIAVSITSSIPAEIQVDADQVVGLSDSMRPRSPIPLEIGGLSLMGVRNCS